MAPLIANIDELKTQLDKLRPLSPIDEQRLRAKLNLEWNYHSNALEGNTLTLGETRAFLYHGITARGKPFKDYLDIKGHKAAIEHIEAIVREQHPLTEADIRYLHEILLVEPYEMPALTPDGQQTKRTIRLGEYKSMPNHVRTPTGELHTYASPEETPAVMGDLMAWYRQEMQKAELHPVVIAALFHYRFVAIHPFDDGNGRMARLLMNLSLMQSGYVPLVIKKEQRGDYLLALSQADTGETEPFIEFIAKLELAYLELYLKAARGEPLEAPDDLDKRLSLLRQQLSGEEEQQQTHSAKNLPYLAAGFLVPFLERLTIQLPKFDPFFQTTNAKIAIEPQYGIFVEPPKLSEFSEIVNQTIVNQTTYDEDVRTILLVYTWSGFIENSDQHLSLHLLLDFRSQSQFICQWDLHKQRDFLSSPEHFSNTLVNMPYNDIDFNDDEIAAKVTIITDAVYQYIEDLVESHKQ